MKAEEKVKKIKERRQIKMTNEIKMKEIKHKQNKK